MTWLDLPADHPYGIANLPYGVFSTAGTAPRVGVRVGDHVLDAGACAEQAGMESGAVWLAPSLNPFLAEGPPGVGRRPPVAHGGAHERGAPRCRGAAPAPPRRRDPAPAHRGRRLRRLLRQRAPRHQRRAHLPPRLRAAHPQLEAPADRLPRPLRHHRRVGHRHRPAQRAAQAPDRAAAGVRAVGAARHRGRAGLRGRRRHPAGRAGAAGGCRRAPLRRRPPQRLVGARPAGVGVRAARPVPRQVVRHLHLAVGGHDRGAAGRPGAAARAGPRAAPLPARRADRRRRGHGIRARRAPRGRLERHGRLAPASSATCTGRRPRWWRT